MNVKMKLNSDELALLTAMVISMTDDVKKGMFDDMTDEVEQRAMKSFAGLTMKVIMANFDLMKSSDDEPMDAEILDDEEED